MPNSNYLCFTANQAGSQIKLMYVGQYYPATTLYYSYNSSNWFTYSQGTTLTFQNIGDCIYFKGTNNGFAYDMFNYVCFYITGSVSGTGDVTTLLNETGGVTDLSGYNERTFCNLFYGCTGLTSFADLYPTKLSESAYESMFRDCVNLVSAPRIHATTLAAQCYMQMFMGCTSLITPPELPVTNLAIACYFAMFQECSSLTSAPKLPAVQLKEYCYTSMFYKCSRLTTPPALPATTAKRNCYDAMFGYCTSLTSLPELIATGLTWYCYAYMFDGCTNIKISETQTGEYQNAYTFAEVPSSNNSSYMFDHTGGTFTGTPTQITYYTSNSIVKPYDYLCFTAETAGARVSTGQFGSPSTPTVEYSTDGDTWNSYTWGNSITLENVGDKVYFRGTNNSFATDASNYNYFNIAQANKVACSGDVTTLLNNTGWVADLSDYGERTFYALFSAAAGMTTAPDLPSTKLQTSCYGYMFANCISLTTAPSLPATTVASGCYSDMFRGCTSLTTAPSILPAIDLTGCGYCYAGMFYDCRALTSTPILPATTLVDSCYSNMFYNCASLTQAPALPATTLASSCYQYMFYYCQSLTVAPELPATTLVSYCYNNMFGRCTSLTSITVNFTSWPDDSSMSSSTYRATYNWVYKVNTTGGTFTAPDSLPREYSAHRIPTNWQSTQQNLTITMGSTSVYTADILSTDTITAVYNGSTISTGAATLATANTYTPYDIIINKNGAELISMSTAGSYIPNDVTIAIA